ncbi:unnamed protein product, partial [Phaeothamnion confervicola]
RVGSIADVFYFPDFLTEEEETAVLRQVDAVPEGHPGWVVLRSRRLQCWGGRPGDNFRPEPLPPWLDTVCASLADRGIFSRHRMPNHVLINDYARGQGILPHTDGGYYYNLTATMSLASDAVMTFAPRLDAAQIGVSDAGPVQSLLLRRRSLVVFAGDAYAKFLHAVAAADEEIVGKVAPCVNREAAAAEDGEVVRRGRRVSLTIRHV